MDKKEERASFWGRFFYWVFMYMGFRFIWDIVVVFLVRKQWISSSMYDSLKELPENVWEFIFYIIGLQWLKALWS